MDTRSRLFGDTVPHIPSAGISTSVGDDGTAQCVKYDGVRNAPPTPDSISRFRKSTKEAIGKTIRHYGRVDDEIPDEQFGLKNVYNHSAADLVSPPTPSELQSHLQDVKESIYKSHQREPLGSRYTHGYVFPDKVKGAVIESALSSLRPAQTMNPDSINGRDASEREFRFGAATKWSENVKELLYPADELSGPMDKVSEQENTWHKMYVKTHHDFGPGEQKNRNYTKNETFDPVRTQFGIPVASRKAKEDTAAACLGHALSGFRSNEAVVNNPHATAIVAREVGLAKMVNHDVVGQPRNLGRGTNASPPSVFGQASDRPVVFAGSQKASRNPITGELMQTTSIREDQDAGRCISGNYSIDEQNPDVDLGRSRNRLNSAGFYDPETRLGITTIRTDRQLPKNRSVADHRNYGDEPDAKKLLFPSKYSERGIFEEDFLTLRPKEEIRDIVYKAGILDDLISTIRSGHINFKSNTFTPWSSGRDQATVGGSSNVIKTSGSVALYKREPSNSMPAVQQQSAPVDESYESLRSEWFDRVYDASLDKLDGEGVNIETFRFVVARYMLAVSKQSS